MMRNGAPKKAGSRWSNDRTSIIPDIVEPEPLLTRRLSRPLKEWFDRLASRNGLCCAFADGVSLQDVDWDSQEGQYRVLIYGQWFVVPDAAVVTEPNRFGPCRRVAL